MLAPTFARGPRLHRTGAAEPSGRDAASATRPFSADKGAGRGNQRHVPPRHDGEIARLTLDRPEARNAIPAPAGPSSPSGSTRSRLRRAAADRRGAGDAFCAGADSRRFPGDARRRSGGARPLPRGDARRARRASRRSPIPTIAADRRAPATAPASRSPWPATCASPGPQRPLRDHAGQDRHRLSAGGRASAGRAGRSGPGGAAAVHRAGVDGAEAARIGLVELARGEPKARWRRSPLRSSPTSPKASPRSSAASASPRRQRSDAGQDRAFDDLDRRRRARARLEAATAEMIEPAEFCPDRDSGCC